MLTPWYFSHSSSCAKCTRYRLLMKGARLLQVSESNILECTIMEAYWLISRLWMMPGADCAGDFLLGRRIFPPDYYFAKEVLISYLVLL